jgi:hypothetical protein
MPDAASLPFLILVVCAFGAFMVILAGGMIATEVLPRRRVVKAADASISSHSDRREAA